MGYSELPVEIKYKIFEYIKPCILLRIKRIDRDFYECITAYIQFKFNTSPIFAQFFPQCSGLYDTLLDCGCILSGSSILCFLLDDVFIVNNLNIFSVVASKNSIESFLQDNGYEENQNFYTDIEGDLVVSEYWNERGKTIQVILCEDPLFCVKSFDFTFLKNFYDGNHFVVTDSHLETKKEILTAKHFFLCDRKMIYKYLARGFDILTPATITASPPFA